MEPMATTLRRVRPWALLLLLPGLAFGQTGQDRKTRYTGCQLEGNRFECTSDQLAEAGFWREAPSGGVSKSASITTQPGNSNWHITIQGGTARVLAAGHSAPSGGGPQEFSVERTPIGLLLLSKRATGESPQVITIDLSNASFVYSNQHVNPAFNRAAVWYGSCIQSAR